MRTRFIAVFALSLVFLVGAFAVAERITIAQAPVLPVASEPAAPAPAPQPAAPPPAAIEPPAPVVTAPPPADVPPVVATPPQEATPPVVTAPPAPEPAPVVVAPPAPAPAPVVTVPMPMPPVKPATAEEKLPAKLLFSKKELPSLGKAMAIGYYPRGCLQGGVELPVDGPNWQVMRLSRNRNWGHPELIKFLEKFAPRAAQATGWKGVLIGDMAQPRGGPLPFGHLSHQIGLDVDIWFMPMPNHELSKKEREDLSAINVVSADWLSINPKVWTPQHFDFIRTAAEQPDVERVLVNAAIKKEMCRIEGKQHFSWMSKVRPWYGHHDHIHVRLKCPADSPNCRAQPPVPGDDGCSDKELAFWFSDKVLNPPKPTTPRAPSLPANSSRSKKPPRSPTASAPRSANEISRSCSKTSTPS